MTGIYHKMLWCEWKHSILNVTGSSEIMFTGTYITINTYIKKSQTNNSVLPFLRHWKKMSKVKIRQGKKRTKTIKIRMVINVIEKRKNERFNKTESWLFEKHQQYWQNFSYMDQERRFKILKSVIKGGHCSWS